MSKRKAINSGITTMKTYTVELERWYCYGNPHYKGDDKIELDSTNRYEPRLLSKWGMCCLGFCLVGEGVPETKLSYRGMPAGVCMHEGIELPLFAEPLALHNGYANTPLSKSASEINDNKWLPIECKMGLLTTLFMDHGLDIVFV